MRPSAITAMRSATDERLVLVVRDEHDRRARGAQQPEHLRAHLAAHLDVEVAERLVEQHDRRPRRDRSGDRHPLLLPARQLVRVALRVRLQPRQGQHLRDSLAPLVASTAC